MIRNGCRLRQMRDAKDLSIPAQSPDMIGNLQAGLPADADINFIKYHGLTRTNIAAARFKCQRNTRYFAAGRNFRQGLFVFPDIG